MIRTKTTFDRNFFVSISSISISCIVMLWFGEDIDEILKNRSISSLANYTFLFMAGAGFCSLTWRKLMNTTLDMSPKVERDKLRSTIRLSAYSVLLAFLVWGAFLLVVELLPRIRSDETWPSGKSEMMDLYFLVAGVVFMFGYLRKRIAKDKEDSKSDADRELDDS